MVPSSQHCPRLFFFLHPKTLSRHPVTPSNTLVEFPVLHFVFGGLGKRHPTLITIHVVLSKICRDQVLVIITWKSPQGEVVTASAGAGAIDCPVWDHSRSIPQWVIGCPTLCKINFLGDNMFFSILTWCQLFGRGGCVCVCAGGGGG